MLKSVLVSLTAAATIALSAAPALAARSVSIVDGKCLSVADARGCLFNGNVAPLTAPDIGLVYNLYNDTQGGIDITPNYLYKSDDNNFAGTLTGARTSAGTWSTPDAISFVAVKAGNYFVLYQLAAPATSGSWSTIDIPFNRNPPALSHLGFFTAGGTGIGIIGGPGVPEPASWALMIAGFGLTGAALRRRRGALAA